MKTSIITALSIAALATPALAADLPMKAAPMAPPPMMISTWTGFYVGLNGGFGWATRDVLGSKLDSPCCVRPDGWFGGGQFGYNYQLGTWLVGLEADFQGGDISDTVNDRNFNNTLHTKVDFFGTVRGRFGYAFDPALIYVTGGLAYGDVENSVSGPFLNGSPYSIDRVRAGFTVGGGVEYRLAHSWSVKAEYLYVNLGKSVPTNPAGQAYDRFSTTFVKDNDFHTIRLGVNYLFGAL